MHYILVHGAWHGAWAWQHVVLYLKALGCQVSAVDLPGHGNNQGNFARITMDSYVEYVANLVRNSELPVALVGHSMAGCVISQVAEHQADKIDRLIYVSGFVPSNNRSLIDEEKQAKDPSVSLEISINEQEHSIILRPEKIAGLFYNCSSQADIKFALNNIQKQPLLPFLSKVSLSDEKFGSVKKLYIECLQDNAVRIEDQRRMHSKIQCDVVSIDTDHSPFFSATDQLVEAMLKNNRL